MSSAGTRTLQLDGLAIYNGFLAGYRCIAGHREFLNTINVFPVPDGDTGNNMVRTFRSIAAGLVPSRSATAVLSRIAELSLKGARGNSGTIVSQFLNGLSSSALDRPILSIRDFGRTVKDSVAYAYRAMENPTEGTILSVVSAWADTIHTESLRTDSINELLALGLKAAKAALDRTPEQLAVLKDNDVLDAGAAGFVRFLEGVSSLDTSGPVPLSFRKTLNVAEESSLSSESRPRHSGAEQELAFRYCTELYLENVTEDTETIRASLTGGGDSLIVSTGSNAARIHVHTDHPSEIVRQSRRFGMVVEQKVDDMVRQAQAVRTESGQTAILTDSIADIPQKVLDDLGIHVLNLNLLWGQEEFLDRLTITPEEFYRQQLVRKDFPSSSVPDADRVKNLFQFLVDQYDSVLVLPVAKALSGTWQLMNSVAKQFNSDRQRIQVVDTCLNSVAQGLLVTEIARMANEGASFDTLVLKAESLKRRIKIYVSVVTFKYMVRGGRISPLKGLLAAFLRLKPIVSLDAEGRGIAMDKAFTGKGLLRKIGAIIQATHDEKQIERYAVVHAAAPDRARRFAGLVAERTGLEADYITSISPIVGMHSGKSAVAVALIEAE